MCGGIRSGMKGAEVGPYPLESRTQISTALGSITWPDLFSRADLWTNTFVGYNNGLWLATVRVSVCSLLILLSGFGT